MAWTQSQLDALDDAIARGVRTVRHNGKSVTYPSLDVMLRLRDRMAKSLSAQRPSVHRIRFDSGL